MKKVGILIVFLILAATCFAFEPPVDFLSLTYEDVAKDPSTKLEDGRLLLTENFDYFNTFIRYTISYDKRDQEDGYVFFNRPVDKTDVFVEFFRDFLMYFATNAEVMWGSHSVDLEVAEMSYHFIFPEKKEVLVYQKISTDTGMYGFGITYVKDSFVEESSKEVLGLIPPIDSYAYLDDFDPDKTSYYEMKAFIPKRAVVTNMYFDSSHFYESYYQGSSWRTDTVYMDSGSDKITCRVETENPDLVKNMFLKINDSIYPLDKILADGGVQLTAYGLKGLCVLSYNEDPPKGSFTVYVEAAESKE